MLVILFHILVFDFSVKRSAVFTVAGIAFFWFCCVGADYVGAWGLEPPLDTATGGLSPPLRNVQKFALYRFLA